MNREEAKREIYGYVHMEDIDDVHEFVDILFDDIESRVCENCKYWNEFGRCTNSQVIVYLNGEQPFTFALFGCNQFNRKENI